MSETPDTPPPANFVCRCEEVTAESLLAEIAAGASSLNDLKRRTRAGMGLCQGAYCLSEMSRMLAVHLGVSIGEITPMTFRPPARAVSIDELARSSD